MQTANRQRRACGSIFGALLLLLNASPVFADSAPSPCDFDSGTQAGLCASTVPGGIGVSGWLHENEQSPAQESTNDPLAVDDERSLQTADAKANPASGSYKDRCKELFIGKAANSPIVSDDATIVRCELPPDPEGGPNQDPGRVPTTRDILYLASTVIHADGAGLYKRPLGVSYTNKFIPTIVAVTSPTQTHVINLLGRDITITLTATELRMELGRWNSEPGHHLHRISVVRGHGFEHRPEPDPPLLHPTPRLALHARWPLPSRRPRHHPDHHVEWNRHQPLHRGNTNHQRPRHHHRNNRQIPPVPPGHQQHRHLGRKTRPLTG